MTACRLNGGRNWRYSLPSCQMIWNASLQEHNAKDGVHVLNGELQRSLVQDAVDLEWSDAQLLED